MKNRTSKILFSCSLLVLPTMAQPALQAQAAPAGSSAIADYSRGNYRSALGKFNQGKARDANSRYYAALCEQNLNLITEARSDYTWVSTYGPEPLRTYARTGLTNLSKLSRRPVSTPPMLASFAAPSIASLSQHAAPMASSASPVKKVMEFYTNTCPTCQEFAPVWQASQSHFKNVEFVSVNAQEETDLAAQYGVRQYPTLVLLDSRGKVLSSRAGAPRTVADFEKHLQAYGAK
jgi:thioredoxin 1